MITFYNKLPVPKVICQDCIAHPNCTRFLRHLRADERVHTQHMQNGGLSYAAWPAKDKSSFSFFSQIRALSFNAVINFLYSKYRTIFMAE